MDPLAHSYAWNAPYSFAENDVIKCIDLDGLEKVAYGAKNGADGKPNAYEGELSAVTTATKLGVVAQYTMNGRFMLRTLVTETEFKQRVETFVYYGHSWTYVMYSEMEGKNGFYTDKKNVVEPGPYSVDLSDLKKLTKSGEIKTSAHSLFIFAGCGTIGNNRNSDVDASGTFDTKSFAAQFGQNVLKPDNFVGDYKVTTIGATGLVNFVVNTDGTTDGSAKTDGSFIKVERIYRTSYDFSKGLKAKTILISTKITDLGKKINPAEIVKEHDPNDTTIKPYPPTTKP